MQSRIIPSIEQVRQHPTLRALETEYGRDAIVAAVREEAEALRASLASAAANDSDRLPADAHEATDRMVRGVERRLRTVFAGSLRPVINATGVVVHTNLGRAPLAAAALDHLVAVARGYSNLEYDVDAGTRGKREGHAAKLLTRLTGAEAAVVVNNNAAATLLILAALAENREVIVSRGELVEIGGGFRVPEVMAQSGAILREVGTTNKTRIRDYEAALSDRTALVLRVHRSNFRIEGFTEQPTYAELVALGRRANVPVVEDLGSGLLDVRRPKPEVRGLMPNGLTSDTGRLRPASASLAEARADSQRAEAGHRTSDNMTGVESALLVEPTVRASIAAGLDLVCFSGDKLLGGPQAGIVVGRTALVEPLRTHPLMRALRVDKLTYAALEATLLEYLAGREQHTVPVARMLALTPAEIEARARAVIDQVGNARAFSMEIRDGVSAVGGGSAPGIAIPTRLLALTPTSESPTAPPLLAERPSELRRGSPKPAGDGGRKSDAGILAAPDATDSDVDKATTLAAALRASTPPVIARVEDQRVVLDLRTVSPGEDAALAAVLSRLSAA